VRDWHHRQLKSGGTLEDAAAMTRTRTTQFYDRRRDDITLDELYAADSQRTRMVRAACASCPGLSFTCVCRGSAKSHQPGG
jgi:hypothetical protein